MDFPPTFVINLDSRPDKWAQIQKSFESWPVKLERVSAVKASPGWKGCLRSHKKVLQICKDRKLPFAIVLEDDCMLMPGGKEKFLSLLPSLQKRSGEWDVFLGGATFLEKIKLKQQNPPLFQVEGYTTHFCLVNENGMNKILKNLNEDEQVDIWYRKNLRLWVTTPHIATQAPSKSDVGEAPVDYTGFFSKAEKDLQESSQMLEGFLATSKSTTSQIIIADVLVIAALFSIWWLFSPANRRKPFR